MAHVDQHSIEAIAPAHDTSIKTDARHHRMQSGTTSAGHPSEKLHQSDSHLAGRSPGHQVALPRQRVELPGVRRAHPLHQSSLAARPGRERFKGKRGFAGCGGAAGILYLRSMRSMIWEGSREG